MKYNHYKTRGIEGYWTVNPIAQQVTVLTRVAELDEAATFAGEVKITSIFWAELAPG